MSNLEDNNGNFIKSIEVAEDGQFFVTGSAVNPEKDLEQSIS